MFSRQFSIKRTSSRGHTTIIEGPNQFCQKSSFHLPKKTPPLKKAFWMSATIGELYWEWFTYFVWKLSKDDRLFFPFWLRKLTYEASKCVSSFFIMFGKIAPHILLRILKISALFYLYVKKGRDIGSEPQSCLFYFRIWVEIWADMWSNL